jgi:NRAMP (natural resistance-associated macrophage protein)-like metal ion transporter
MREASPQRVSWFRRLGPGLITGAADDDPGGIATHSQVGAQFGLNLMWTVALTYPLMTAIQSICARIGRVTGEGLAANMAHVLPRWLVHAIVALLFVANTVNIGADLAAMGAAARLVLGWGEIAFAVVFAVGSILLQVFVLYHRYVHVLKWLTLSLLAYVGVVFTVAIDWARSCAVCSGHCWSSRGRPWWRSSLYSARRSAPTCSSGRAPKRWKTSFWPVTARCLIIQSRHRPN